MMQKLFAITASKAIQPIGILPGFSKEIDLQTIAADNLGALFGIRFFASEYSIEDMRIDTVGISEDFRPVLIEYKKGKDSTVVPQILSYYHGFMENKADFLWKVSEKLGSDTAKKLDFKDIRLICLAGEFNKLDLRAWKSHQNIELVTYRYFENNTLLLEWIKGDSPPPSARKQKPLPKPSTPAPASPPSPRPASRPASNIKNVHSTLRYKISKCNSSTKALYNELSQGIANLGKDVTHHEGGRLNTFKVRQRFAALRPFPKKNKVTILVKLDPKQEDIIPGFTRDTTNITTEANDCHLEITVKDQQQVKKALKLCRKAYDQAKL